MARRLIAVLLVASIAIGGFAPVYAADADSAIQGTIDGGLAGRQHPTGAFGWSFAWGALAGFFGAAASLVYYGVQDPSPTPTALLTLSDRPTEYRVAYIDAYRRAAHGKMVRMSLIGAGLGWLVGFAVVAASAHDGASVTVASASW